jgi:hypothetical protein
VSGGVPHELISAQGIRLMLKDDLPKNGLLSSLPPR